MGQLEEQNKRVVLDLFEALMRIDIEKLKQLLADDLKWALPFDPAYTPSATIMDKKAFFAGVPSFLGLMKSGIKVTVKGIIAEGNRVAAEGESCGETDKGPYRNRFHFLAEVRDGQITACREYLDSAYLNAFLVRFSAQTFAQPHSV